MCSPKPFLSNTLIQLWQLIQKKIRLDFSLTEYSTDRTIHAKLVWLAIRTKPLSRFSFLGASIK